MWVWLFFIILIICAVIIWKSWPARATEIIGAGSGFFEELVARRSGHKYFSLRDEPSLSTFFPAKLLPRVQDFWFTPEGVYSMTHLKDAAQTCKVIARRMARAARDLVITDATACIGGNTIAFARSFKAVNAVEINQINFGALAHNVKLLGLKVNTVFGDFLKVGPGLTQDVIFIDPPWGGLDYRATGKVSLELSGRPLAAIVAELPCPVFIKAPHNFDRGAFEHLVGPCEVDEFKKFILIYKK